ncbi:serine hydrolase domain-containing protein [Nocardia vaccinii]|uniref:serine hydrolase domain-containing protein n=1 Tax=Nocardia vaccinii TaxID=1822 RepID=UPI0008296C53|nr:serine hydrolase domain-containing protein [Nocardia vaccinii]
MRFGRRAVIGSGLALALLPVVRAGAVPASVGAGPDANLARVLRRFVEQQQLPGLAAQMWRGSNTVVSAAAGVRKSGDPAPVTVGDCWHLGSDTKAMTATLVGISVDRGRLCFEDRLADVLGGPLHPAYAGVTIEQLLWHRGGAPANPPGALQKLMHFGGDPAVIRAAVARGVLSQPPAQPPGQFAYSNIGYLIVGAILEQRAMTSWENLMRAELFAPLRMDSAAFGPPGTPARVDQPWGHTSTLQPLSPGDPRADNPPALGPAGTVHCTLGDWGRFLEQHLAGARGEPSLLTAATMARLHRPPPGGDYAAGWIVTTQAWANGPVLTHTGSNTLWTAETWLAPAENLILAVVTNRGGDRAQHAIRDVVHWLIDNEATG